MTKTELEKLEELADDLECMRESSFSHKAYAAYDSAFILVRQTIAALKKESEINEK
jgi:hypothetical protein